MIKNETKTGHHKSSLALFVMSALLSALMSGCATTKPADFVLAGFDSNSINSIAVLPVLDHRIDQSQRLDLDAWVLPRAEGFLKKKGYSYTIERNRSLIANISRDDLASPSRDFIASLPPASARWVLILVLDDSSSKLTFGSTGNAEMSGYIFDKDKGKLTWRNKELGRVGQGGLIGMMMKGLMERSAIEQATIQMFQTLPDHKT